MLNLRFVCFCLAACFLSCAAAPFPAPAQTPPKAAVPKAATLNVTKNVTQQEAFAFSKAIQKEDVVGVAKALKAHPNLANAPLVYKKEGWIGIDTHLPLLLASFEGNAPIAALLIQFGANVNAEDENFGKTALDQAVTFHYPQVVTLLLAHGANIEFKDTAGVNALHEAVTADDPNMVALLLEHGATVNARDVEGETPLALLRNPNLQIANHAAILAVLRRHGAKE